ncbi:helix-turn-helix domain-containing protein [Amycolatopsis sp. NPDC047767]|uniref:helix-turn-helix domain-containing protein n=1 Tax=Amycolatopsis sp. NPDC047767 TaxID=3156765 RepID=UPI0034537AD2
MRELAGRMRAIDPGAGAALQVVAHFDALVEARAGLEATVRAAAVLAGCAAGLAVPGRRLRVRVEPDGRRADGQPVGLSVPLPGYAGAVVWVERVAEDPGRAEFDRVLADRLATTAAIVLDRTGAAVPPGDPASVELLLDATADETGRLAAARRLGLSADGSFTVTVRANGPSPPGAARLGDLAVTIDPVASPPRAAPGSARFDASVTQVGAAATAERAGEAKLERPVARMREVGAVAVPASGGSGRATRPASAVVNPASAGAPPAVRSASGPAVPVRELPVSYAQAVLALRLTTVDEPGPSHVDAAELGGLLALADGCDSPAATAEVSRLDRVLAAHPWALATLTAVAAEPSLRAAAAVLHVHHSTLQSRVDLLAQALGYGVASPAGRTRLTVALVLRRFRGTR